MSSATDFIVQRDADAVVIGGSSGGVEALQQLLAALPANFAPAVLVVLHLPRQRPSQLAEVLGHHCALPVTEAVDKQSIDGGCVVFAPPDYHLLVEPGRTLALSVDEPVLHSRPAIDPLFESAAAVYGRRLLGLLLTGASEDGTAGVAAIRRCGGQAWIQHPADAQARTMPESALARAGADAVLSLDAMCRRLSTAGQGVTR